MNTRFKEDVHRLFEYWCEISPTAVGDEVSGVIVESFPDTFDDIDTIKKIPEFAYPCQFVNETVQTYSFVLTTNNSKWLLGFCRHDINTQTAMVFITHLPWHDTFLKFINVLGELRRRSKSEFQAFLAEAYAKGVPEPGSCLKLFYNSGLNHIEFHRPSQFQLPSIPQNHNLNLYYSFVDPKNMIEIFAAMLAERRIIFTSQRLDWLSSCVQAANAFLYPMVWQHIFIPILPLTIKDYLTAPMPYLIGTPVAVLETMSQEELGDVVIFNCDNKFLQTPFNDVKNMPDELVSHLKKQLNNQHDHIGDRVSRIFLGVLVQLIGGYRDAFKYQSDAKAFFCKEIFIESRPSHLRKFLQGMLQLQIFRQFIDERLAMLNNGMGLSDEFELETLKYHEKHPRRGKKLWSNVKDKTNPVVKSAVQSVKQGGRGMKSACKELKSKIDKRTSKGAGRSSSMAPNANATTSLQFSSAPNSPVFSKRTQNDSISSNSSTHRSTPPQSILQTSNSMTNNTNHFMHTSSSLNHSDSPNSSLSSSSEMNILQELQQHNALFKVPTVDRSLKPVNSLEPARRSSRSGSLVTTPDHHTKIVPTGQLLTFDSEHQLNVINNFDAVPDTTPPVPPRIPIPPRPSNDRLVNIDNNDNCSYAPIPIPRHKYKSSTASNTFAVNAMDRLAFDTSGVHSVGKPPTSSIASVKRTRPLPEQSTTNAINSKTNPNKINLPEAQEAANDLIELDTSLSYELDDFDPLKPNAKKLPLQSKVPTTRFQASVASTTPIAVSNPIYPFYAPNNLPAAPAPPPVPSSTTASTAKLSQFDEDDLLRNFGLHNLIVSDRSCGENIKPSQIIGSRNSTNTMSSGNGYLTTSESRDFMQQTNQSRNIKDWTTFD